MENLQAIRKTSQKMKTIEKVSEKPKYTIDKHLKSHANDPVVKRKVEKAREMLAKLHPSLKELN